MGRAADAWVSFEVTVRQETRRRRRESAGRPVHVKVSRVAIGYALGSDYRQTLYESRVDVPEGFELTGAPEYAAELAADAIRKAHPGLF